MASILLIPQASASARAGCRPACTGLTPYQAATLLKATGIIVPARWDDRGRVVSVAIATYTEAQYLVANLEAVPELLGHQKRQIEATGRLTSSEGISAIVIEQYHLYDDGPTDILAPAGGRDTSGASPEKKGIV
ncbi:MAG: hypothetical protein JEZ11_19585 [Desulfobacterales bacterium]|nr:hypothetical protein [Desulfobacterales bacterium]